jgi:uncharacterized protein DUF222/HNH endonuclease
MSSSGPRGRSRSSGVAGWSSSSGDEPSPPTATSPRPRGSRTGRGCLGRRPRAAFGEPRPWPRCRPWRRRSERARCPAPPCRFWSLRATPVRWPSPRRRRRSSRRRRRCRSGNFAARSGWRIRADARRAAEDEDRLHERRRLDVAPALDGMIRVAGELDPESGQTLITAIRAVMDVESRRGTSADVPTPTQRRADALGEVCRQWLGSLDRPQVGGERPHVVVTVDLETLLERAGRAGLDDAGPITPTMARRLACDAEVTRVITRGISEPLELGRRTKVVPPSLRRAVTVRDRGCRFPGCDRPSGWCDAHHVRHWADGGETSLGNLVLLCRPHHRAIHRGFGLEMVDGRPRFTRPDGTPIADRGPPAA